jgi:hypothetical protein
LCVTRVFNLNDGVSFAMNYFWTNVFEYFKDRRIGASSFRTFIVVLALLIAAAAFWRYWPYFLGIFGLWLLAVTVREIRHWRAWRLNRYKSSPLSRDEINKARSKLKTNSTLRFKS